MTGDATPKNIVEEPSENRVRSPPSPRSVMPPPPPKTITAPPSKTHASSIATIYKPTTQPSRLQDNHITVKKPNPVPDTLIKLMEYGDDEDDDDDSDETLAIRS
ncbi:hypothetical protein ISN44_As10g008370 [Arabidopsis suecica]|uniref:RIK n=1 Tax=Arabidopsis suecica TaxID=45249 RepID=A0A8T1ZUV8_ARASU|nr:hypothetical protein ISN44_As10g008370 [Arabidopsis suecica]